MSASTEAQQDTIETLFKGENRAVAVALSEIVQDMREWWPLTVRQVFYQAVSRLILPNRQPEYRRVSRNLTTLRRHDLLPWYAIEDRTRTTFGKRGMSNVGEFIDYEVRGFLDPDRYGRCYIQNQPVYVEVATEKDALANVMREAVWMFCTSLNIVRGQVSASMVNQMAERFDRAVMLGKRPILLYFGDLDPSGIAIPKALVRNIADWHSVEVELIRVALTPAQVEQYKLPKSLDAAKESDPNHGAWVREFGKDQAPVELDALHPSDLTAITQAALASVYDMTEVNANKDQETKERKILKAMRRDVQDFIAARYPGAVRGDLGTSSDFGDAA